MMHVLTPKKGPRQFREPPTAPGSLQGKPQGKQGRQHPRQCREEAGPLSFLCVGSPPSFGCFSGLPYLLPSTYLSSPPPFHSPLSLGSFSIQCLQAASVPTKLALQALTSLPIPEKGHFQLQTGKGRLYRQVAEATTAHDDCKVVNTIGVCLTPRTVRAGGTKKGGRGGWGSGAMRKHARG